MSSNLYRALQKANVPDDMARKAAEEVADYQRQIADMKADMLVLKWMTGTVIGLCLTILFKLFS